jgi:azurin
MKTKLAITLLSIMGLSAFSSVALAGTKIEITASDQMQFNTKAIEVPAGEEVTLVFNNLGKLPKAAMGHNVVILKPDSDVMAFGAGAVAAAATEYVPASGPLADQIVAHTKLLGPGETDTITFTLEAGIYKFLCSFPGHYALMQGTITAK